MNMNKYTIALILKSDRLAAVSAIQKQFSDAILTDHEVIELHPDGSHSDNRSIEITIYGEATLETAERIRAGIVALQTQFVCGLINTVPAHSTFLYNYDLLLTNELN